MLKNVIIINDFDYIQGGASKVAIQTANILADSNNDLHVYFFSAAHSDETPLDDKVIKICTNQGESLSNKNKVKGIFNNIYNFKAAKELKKLLRSMDENETIIHIHGWTKALSSSVFRIPFKLKYKVVLTMHDYFTACPNGGYYNYKRSEICHLRPLSKKCITCNCDSRNFFFKMFRIIRQFVQNKIVKLNENLTDVISISDFSENILRKTLSKSVRIHRVYNPIDLDTNPKRVDYTKNKYFLFVGRISKEKGVDLFCDAITKAKVRGVVVGDGPELQSLKEKYKNVQFVGWKNSIEVKEYMKNSKALVIPSRWYECAPLTPYEAMQYGIPIITSDCNASIDYLNNDNGISFSIKENNLDEILKHFSNDFHPHIDRKMNYVGSIIDLYKKVLK